MPAIKVPNLDDKEIVELSETPQRRKQPHQTWDNNSPSPSSSRCVSAV